MPVLWALSGARHAVLWQLRAAIRSQGRRLRGTVINSLRTVTRCALPRLRGTPAARQPAVRSGDRDAAAPGRKPAAIGAPDSKDARCSAAAGATEIGRAHV